MRENIIVVCMGLGLCAPAFASPGHAGLGHIGALPVDADQQWVGAGLGAVFSPDGGLGGGLVEAGTALGDRGALHLQLGTDSLLQGQAASLSGRYLLVDEEGLRFAVTGQWLAYRYPETSRADRFFVETKLSPGIALDAGGDNVRVDLSLPIWGLISVDQFVGVARFPFPLAGTAGVSVRVADRHRFRFGLPETFSWHIRGDSYYVDFGAFPFVAGFVWAKAGVVF